MDIGGNVEHNMQSFENHPGSAWKYIPGTITKVQPKSGIISTFFNGTDHLARFRRHDTKYNGKLLNEGVSLSEIFKNKIEVLVTHLEPLTTISEVIQGITFLATIEISDPLKVELVKLYAQEEFGLLQYAENNIFFQASKIFINHEETDKEKIDLNKILRSGMTLKLQNSEKMIKMQEFNICWAKVYFSLNKHNGFTFHCVSIDDIDSFVVKISEISKSADLLQGANVIVNYPKDNITGVITELTDCLLPRKVEISFNGKKEMAFIKSKNVKIYDEENRISKNATFNIGQSVNLKDLKPYGHNNCCYEGSVNMIKTEENIVLNSSSMKNGPETDRMLAPEMNLSGQTELIEGVIIELFENIYPRKVKIMVADKVEYVFIHKSNVLFYDNTNELKENFAFTFKIGMHIKLGHVTPYGSNDCAFKAFVIVTESDILELQSVDQAAQSVCPKSPGLQKPMIATSSKSNANDLMGIITELSDLLLPRKVKITLKNKEVSVFIHKGNVRILNANNEQVKDTFIFKLGMCIKLCDLKEYGPNNCDFCASVRMSESEAHSLGLIIPSIGVISELLDKYPRKVKVIYNGNAAYVFVHKKNVQILDGKKTNVVHKIRLEFAIGMQIKLSNVVHYGNNDCAFQGSIMMTQTELPWLKKMANNAKLVSQPLPTAAPLTVTRTAASVTKVPISTVPRTAASVTKVPISTVPGSAASVTKVPISTVPAIVPPTIVITTAQGVITELIDKVYPRKVKIFYNNKDRLVLIHKEDVRIINCAKTVIEGLKFNFKIGTNVQLSKITCNDGVEGCGYRGSVEMTMQEGLSLGVVCLQTSKEHIASNTQIRTSLTAPPSISDAKETTNKSLSPSFSEERVRDIVTCDQGTQTLVTGNILAFNYCTDFS